MKIIFRDQLQICIGRGDDTGTFIPLEIHKDRCLKKTCTFQQSMMISGYVSGKCTWEAVITPSVNAHYFWTLSCPCPINWKFDLADDEIIFHDASNPQSCSGKSNRTKLESDWWRVLFVIHQTFWGCELFQKTELVQQNTSGVLKCYFVVVFHNSIFFPQNWLIPYFSLCLVQTINCYQISYFSCFVFLKVTI